MNLRKSYLFAVAYFFMICLSSCTKGPKQAEYIPKNAASVIVVDMPSIKEKTGKDVADVSIKIFDYLKRYGFSNETFDMAIHSMFTKSEETGIQTDNSVIAYLVQSKTYRNAFRCTLLTLKDSSTFSKYIVKAMGDNFQRFDAGENCSAYINKSDGFSWVAYNDEVVVFGCAVLQTQGIEECLKDIFSGRKRASLAKNSDFASFWNNKNDISMWVSTTDIINCYLLWYKNLPQFLTEKNISEESLGGSYVYASADFDKNIQIKLHCTPSRAFKRYWKHNNFVNKTTDTTLYKYLPKNTLWYSSTSIDIMKLINQIEDSKAIEYVKKELAKLNLTIDDLANSFTGNCVFSMYDLSMENIKTFSIDKCDNTSKGSMIWKQIFKDEQTTFPRMVVACSLNNDKIPNMVLTHISEQVCENLSPGFFDFSKIMGFPAFVICKDNVYLFTTDKNYAEILSRNDENYIGVHSIGIDTRQMEMQSQGKCLYGYIDFAIDNYPQNIRDYFSKIGNLKALESHASIVKSAEMNITDSYTGTIVVNLQDTTKNSLYQLNNLMNVILPK